MKFVVVVLRFRRGGCSGSGRRTRRNGLGQLPVMVSGPDVKNACTVLFMDNMGDDAGNDPWRIVRRGYFLDPFCGFCDSSYSPK